MSRPALFPGGMLSRRRWLATTGALASLTSSGKLGATPSVPSGLGTGRAKHVIVLFLHGGAATQDMYDLKPDGPSPSRSQFAPIDTSIPGIQVCEHLPLLSKWMHRAAVIRSVSHQSGCHNTAPAFSGHEGLVPNQRIEDLNHPPSMGSTVEYLHQQSHKNFHL